MPLDLDMNYQVSTNVHQYDGHFIKGRISIGAYKNGNVDVYVNQKTSNRFPTTEIPNYKGKLLLRPEGLEGQVSVNLFFIHLLKYFFPRVA